MLRLLAPGLPSRVARSSLVDILLDDGKSRVEFNRVSSGTATPYLVTNYLPPAPSPPSDIDTPNSSLCPPFHIHLKEDETFRVVSGSAAFLLMNQQAQRWPAVGDVVKDGVTRRTITSGQSLTISRGSIHTFRNASYSQPLVLEFGFSPPGSNATIDALHSKMRRFFLNAQLYRDDYRAQNLPRSLLQVLIFNHQADVALMPDWLCRVHQQVPLLRNAVERMFAPALGRLMNFWGGIVLGKWLMGLKSNYHEYDCGAREEAHQKSEEQAKDSLGLGRDMRAVSKNEAAQRAETVKAKAPKMDVSQYACQAWRDHSFDGQDDSWRK